MSWSSEDIARLKTAIASGQLTVRIGESSITYQSTREMMAVLDRMQADNAAAAASAAGPRRATSRWAFLTGRGW